ncbi:MAG: DUF4981 domain-containing protein, partial [bacterium]|nr:DUF4981 domain-containing protein [bacterium]
MRITNLYDFLDLSHLKGTWKITRDGDTVQSGALPLLALSAHSRQTIDIPCNIPENGQG